MWTGRLNVVKNWKLAFDILHMLKLDEREVEVYVPQTIRGMTEGGKALMDYNLPFFASMPGREFMIQAGQTKICLITSTLEALGTAYYEMMERGVIPVFWERPWNRHYVSGNQWPYRFKTADEGVAMCMELLDNTYSWNEAQVLLENAVKRSHGGKDNICMIVEEVWNRYLSSGQEQEFNETWGEGRVK